MAININNKSIEKVIYNDKQVNITKFKGNIVLEDNFINNLNFQGNTTISSLNEDLTENLLFKSNNTEYVGMKITSSYLYYINGTEEIPVYSYSNNSWAAAYKTISTVAYKKQFVSTKFYDWFNINYIIGE